MLSRFIAGWGVGCTQSFANFPGLGERSLRPPPGDATAVIYWYFDSLWFDTSPRAIYDTGTNKFMIRCESSRCESDDNCVCLCVGFDTLGQISAHWIIDKAPKLHRRNWKLSQISVLVFPEIPLHRIFCWYESETYCSTRV